MGVNSPSHYDEEEQSQEPEILVTFPELWEPNPEKATPYPEEWKMGQNSENWYNSKSAELDKPLTWEKNSKWGGSKVPNWEKYFQNADIESIPVSKKASEHFSRTEILQALSQIRDAALNGEKLYSDQLFHDPEDRGKRTLQIVYDDYKGTPYVIHFFE